jgi:hypothetical protein
MPIAGGYIDRLGIELGYAAEAAVPAALLPNETASGHFIRRVDPDGIARGLLQPTDSILAVNDIPIASLHPKALRDLIAAHASAPEAALLRILVFRNSGTERPSRVLCNLVLPSPPAFSAPPPNQRHEVIEAADALASARGSTSRRPSASPTSSALPVLLPIPMPHAALALGRWTRPDGPLSRPSRALLFVQVRSFASGARPRWRRREGRTACRPRRSARTGYRAEWAGGQPAKRAWGLHGARGC